MAIIKSYTDLEQSRKLAEILSHDTADGTWKRFAIAGCNLDVPEEQQYFHDGDTPFIYYSGIGIPSWSLAALLSIIEMECYLTLFHDGVAWNINVISHDATLANLPNHHYNADGSTSLDACYEMIIKLHEKNLL